MDKNEPTPEQVSPTQPSPIPPPNDGVRGFPIDAFDGPSMRELIDGARAGTLSARDLALLDDTRQELRGTSSRFAQDAIRSARDLLTDSRFQSGIQAAARMLDSPGFREAQRATEQMLQQPTRWEVRDRDQEQMLRAIAAPRVSPLEARIADLQATVDDLRAEVRELRRPIAQTDLRTERIADYLQPPDDLDSPQAPSDAEE